MPRIIPIKDLKNTGEISDMCHAEENPIFITKNGYGDMVIMSMETYERSQFVNNLYEHLDSSKRYFCRKKDGCIPSFGRNEEEIWLII